MAIKVECLLQVGVSLAEIAEAQPCSHCLANLIAGVKLNENLRNFLYYHVVGIYAHGVAVVERYAGVVVAVLRLLPGEESVQVEALKGIYLSRCCPAQCVDVVNKKYGLRF